MEKSNNQPSIQKSMSKDGRYHIQTTNVANDKTKVIHQQVIIVDLNDLPDEMSDKIVSGEYTIERS